MEERSSCFGLSNGARHFEICEENTEASPATPPKYSSLGSIAYTGGVRWGTKLKRHNGVQPIRVYIGGDKDQRLGALCW
jgi:hypothetical protein